MSGAVTSSIGLVATVIEPKSFVTGPPRRRDEDRLGVRQAAEDLVRSRHVERGEARVEHDRELHVSSFPETLCAIR